MNSGYEWLLLKTGEIVIGVKADRCISWAVLDRNGMMSAISDNQIVTRCSIKEPKVVNISCDHSCVVMQLFSDVNEDKS